MPSRNEKSRKAIRSLLNKDERPQLLLFEVSDRPLRDSVFVGNPDVIDKNKSETKKLIENDEK
ncbi:hypothetical protein KAU08_11445 [bacterium]|nr:hypothetical protein [bacterium]